MHQKGGREGGKLYPMVGGLYNIILYAYISSWNHYTGNKALPSRLILFYLPSRNMMALTWKENFLLPTGICVSNGCHMMLLILLSDCWMQRGGLVYSLYVYGITFVGDALYYHFICFLDSFQTHCSIKRNSLSSPVIRMVNVESELTKRLTCILNNCKALGLSQGVSRKCRIHQGHFVPLRGYHTQFKVLNCQKQGDMRTS